MQPQTETPGKERLQKILARAGFGSRRACEELIVDGRVSVNGTTVSVLGTQADISHDVILVDGERVRLPQSSYWIANKPKGVAVSEREAEKFIADVIPGEHPRLFTVGRLDKGSCGLMFVTNDGRVANILTHPRYKVPKSYRLTVRGEVSFATAAQIERALYYAMNGGRFERIRVVRASRHQSILRITAYESLPGSLRDICLKFDHPISLMERVRIGPLELRDLAPGVSRKLRTQEIQALQDYCRRAEAFEIEYEHDLVSSEKFGRDAHAPEFKRKKHGHRSSRAGGQKQAMAQAQERRGPGSRRRPQDGHEGRAGARPDRGTRQPSADETEGEARPDPRRAKPPSFERRGPGARAQRRGQMGRRRPRD